MGRTVSYMKFPFKKKSKLSYFATPLISVSSHKSGWDFTTHGELNKTISQIPECICVISHNATFCNRNVHMCAHFCYKMVHCGIFVWCILGFVRWVYWVLLVTHFKGRDKITNHVCVIACVISYMTAQYQIQYKKLIADINTEFRFRGFAKCSEVHPHYCWVFVIQCIPRIMHSVHASSCFGVALCQSILPLTFRVTSLILGQAYDCNSEGYR